MNTHAAERWKRTAEMLVLQQLNPERPGMSINDIALRAGLRRGTVVGALNRLLESNYVRRRWDGNERFGRFLYYESVKPAVDTVTVLRKLSNKI
jgi:predicted transcriptional regulator